METEEIAEAFSSHRFLEVYDHLADDVRWVLPGQATIQGKAAVVAACESAAGEFAQLAGTDTVRFVSVADARTAAVDATTRYRSPDGSASVVSSADIDEFDQDGLLTTITSYAVELDPES
jgi:ketosteroid isomerase-like protein